MKIYHFLPLIWHDRVFVPCTLLSRNSGHKCWTLVECTRITTCDLERTTIFESAKAGAESRGDTCIVPVKYTHSVSKNLKLEKVYSDFDFKRVHLYPNVNVFYSMNVLKILYLFHRYNHPS